jgi:hypothetical protein
MAKMTPQEFMKRFFETGGFGNTAVYGNSGAYEPNGPGEVVTPLDPFEANGGIPGGLPSKPAKGR